MTLANSPRTAATIVTAIAIAAVMLMASPAGAAKKPPPADGSAQTACQVEREMEVNVSYGIDPSDTDLSLLIQALDESRSKGAAKLHRELFSAPSTASQQSVRTKIAQWCLDTLRIRCSAVACVDGNRVETIKKNA